jgi:outer membrane protein assembly factor BamB
LTANCEDPAWTGDGDTELWQFRGDEGGSGSRPVVAGDIVYVGNDDGNLYAADGSERWRFETGETVSSSPAVVDDTVYVGSRDGTLYAISGDEG